MPQHDQVIDNGPGNAVRSDINNALAAVFSSSSGATAPAVTAEGQLWFDTSSTTNQLRVRNQGNSSWQAIPLPMPSGYVHRIGAADVTISPTGAWQKISLTTLVGGYGGVQLASGHLQVPRAGLYLAGVSVSFTTGAAVGYVLCGLTINSALTAQFQARMYNSTAIAQAVEINCQRLISLSAGDTVGPVVFATIASSQVMSNAATHGWATLVVPTT